LILATTEGVAAPRKSTNGESYIMSTPRQPPVTTSLKKLSLKGSTILQLQQTACWELLQLAPIVRKIIRNKRPNHALTAIWLH